MYINCYFKIRTRNLQILGVNDFPMSMMSSMLFNHTEYTKYFMRRCGSALDTAVVYADWALSLSRKKVGIIFLISPMKKQVQFFFSYYEYMYCIPFLRNKMFMLDYRLERHEAHQLWREISNQYLFILMIIVLCKSLMLDEMT